MRRNFVILVDISHRHVFRLGLAVRDECGVEAVELMDQCGPGQVRLAPSTQHMEHIMQVREFPQSFVLS